MTTEYGYRLAHAFERETVGGFTRPTEAYDALAHALPIPRNGLEGIVTKRIDGGPWEPLHPSPWWWAA